MVQPAIVCYICRGIPGAPLLRTQRFIRERSRLHGHVRVAPRRRVTSSCAVDQHCWQHNILGVTPILIPGSSVYRYFRFMLCVLFVALIFFVKSEIIVLVSSANRPRRIWNLRFCLVETPFYSENRFAVCFRVSLLCYFCFALCFICLAENMLFSKHFSCLLPWDYCR